MATIATCSFPVSVDSVDHTPPVASGRFFIPPSAWGFMIDVDDSWVIDGLGPPYFLMGALLEEGLYSEPALGQIWPRIG